MAKLFHVSIVGGTFDHLHVGHKVLLQEAFLKSENVIVGVAAEELSKGKSFDNSIESYKLRESSVRTYLQENAFLSRAKIIPITDFYGNSLTEKLIDAIFVTDDNQTAVAKMNEERQKRGFLPMKVVTVALQTGNDGKVVTASRIRSGEIDRDGNSYSKLLLQKEAYHLPSSLREAVRKPIGTLFADMDALLAGIPPQAMTITVGDIVTLSYIRHAKQAAVSVVDLITRRTHITTKDEKILRKLPNQLQTQNKPQTIDIAAINTLQHAFTNYSSTQEKQVVIVTGEEDLLVIPAILLAPLNAQVVYGQYDMGIVAVTVTEEKKKEIATLLAKFG